MAKRDDVNKLVQNNLELQKILVDLSLNFKKLTEELSTLVELFREASKTLNGEKLAKDMEKDAVNGMNTKLDSVIDQNKTIAKGLLLMESAVRENLEKRRESF